MGEYADNHIATASYIGLWADPAGRVATVTPPNTTGVMRKPKRVGYRRRFIKDPFLAKAFEQRISGFEGRAVEVLRRIDRSWPLEMSDQIPVAYLIAIHLWRNPAGMRHLLQLQQQSIARGLPGYRKTLSSTQIEELLREVTTERFRINYVLETLPRLASMILSMHWTALDFGSDLLATGDQPVTVMPFLTEGSTARVRPLPDGGLLNSEEIRMAINPRHALVLTWLNEPDDSPPIPAPDELAAELNRAVIAQIDKEWFHHPDRRPTTLLASNFSSRACRPIGRVVLDGYLPETGIDSQRRHDTARNLTRMIDEEITEHLVVAGVARAGV